MTEGDIPDAVLDAAIQWSLRLRSGQANDTDAAACAAWRAHDSLHERAWQQVQAVEQEFAILASAQGPAVRAAIERTHSKESRRRVLKLLGLAALAVPVGGLMMQQVLSPGSDYATATGERRALTLADGARLHLNTATAVDLEITDNGQIIHLREGEILVQSAGGRDTERAISVRISQARLMPIGTRFLVRQTPQYTLLHVLEGAVAMAPRLAGNVQVARAGQTFRIEPDRIHEARMPLAVPDGWVDDVLVAKRMRLADLLEELGRYRRGWLQWNPAVADLRVSGVFQLEDTDLALQALEDSLPVTVRRYTRLWVSIAPQTR